MKKILCVMTLLFMLVMSGFAQVEKIVGEWTTVDDKSGKKLTVVKIYKEKDLYYGKIIKLVDESVNPKSLNVVVIRKMKEKDGMLAGGTVYDPKSGKTYYGTVRYDAEKDVLILRGSIDKFGMLGRSQTWVKK